MAVDIKVSSLHPLDYEPAARFHHSGAVASDGKFYSYGGRFGHVKPGNSSYKEKDELRSRETSSSVVRTTINRFDAATERWHCLPTSGNSPPGRIGVACAVIGTKFYVFGGRSRNRLFSTLSELDLDTMAWKELEPLSPPENSPMAKMGAVMVSFDNRYLIVYGGYGVPVATPPGQMQGVEYVSDPGKGVWTNEMHCFDLKTGKWCQQPTVGKSPPPCSLCTFTQIDKRRAVLFGGSQLKNNCVPNDVYVLDLKSWKWEQVCHGDSRPWPEARVGHSAISLYDPDSNPKEPKLLILWGQDDKTPVSTLRDGWVLKLCKNGNLEWAEILLPDDMQGRLCHTTALFHHSSSHKQLVTFGGVEENDKPPIAKTLVMDISETPTGRWTVSNVRKPDPKTFVHIKSDQEYPGVKFFTESVHKIIPSRNQAKVLDRRDIGLKLSIPAGAIQDEAKDAVELDVQPCFKGPFKVPPGCQLTSPVYMIRKQCKFKKGVKMEIEHFANLESSEDSKEMVFVTANPSPSYHGAHPVYNLQEVDNSGHVSRFTPGEQVGVITFQELNPGPLGTARKSANVNGSDSECKYSVRLYKSPPSLLFNLAIFTICRLHSIYLKHLELLIKENYPSVRLQMSNQPVDFTSSAIGITTNSIEGWTIVPSRKPTIISKDEVDLPENVEISPEELDYPPRIDFNFYSDSRHNDRIEVCNINVEGLDKNVCIPITLALPAPPHSPTSAVGRHVSFDSTPPSSPRHHPDLLTTKDLRTLLTMLHGATTQWEFIGLALGFDPEDLKIIEQTPTLIPKGPVAYLKEMLHQWLKWCPPSHDRPTISSLCEALRNPIVGNEHLANTLKDQLKALRGRSGSLRPDNRNITEAANELEKQAEQCADDNVMGATTKKIVGLLKQIEPFLKDPALTQQLVDQTKLIDTECKQLVELAKEVQKHAVERTKNDLSTQITRVVAFSHQLSLLTSARLASRTANDAEVDIVDWSEAAKNLMSSISGILSSTGAATLQVTPKRKPRISMQAKGLSLREEKRRQTSVDVEALKQALEAKEEKPRRPRAQTSVDVKALTQVLEAKGLSFTSGQQNKDNTTTRQHHN